MANLKTSSTWPQPSTLRRRATDSRDTLVANSNPFDSDPERDSVIALDEKTTPPSRITRFSEGVSAFIEGPLSFFSHIYSTAVNLIGLTANKEEDEGEGEEFEALPPPPPILLSQGRETDVTRNDPKDEPTDSPGRDERAEDQPIYQLQPRRRFPRSWRQLKATLHDINYEDWWGLLMGLLQIGTFVLLFVPAT